MSQETETIATDTKAAAEAADNAFLSKLFAAPKSEQQADEAASDDAGEQDTPKPSGEGDDEATLSEGKAQSDSEWEKACSVLALDNVTKTVMSKLDRAEVLEWASKAKERQAKTANELKSRAERIKELESGVTTKVAETATSAPTATDDDPLTKIREMYGEEFATPLAEMIKRERQSYEQRIASLEADRVREIIGSAKASLRDQFPQLDDPAKLEQVQNEMGLHLQKYQDLPVQERAQMAMRDAARTVLFDEVKASEAGKALAAHRKRIGSQPTPPNGKASSPKAMSPAEREDALLDAIFRNDVEAKERLMRLP
jgi:hypothetical protein